MIQSQTTHDGKSPILHRYTLQDVIGSLPDIKGFNPLAGGESVNIDLFLCALGFEERCLSSPIEIRNHRFTAQRCIYFQYATNKEDNETNKVALEEALNTIASGKVSSIEVDAFPFGRRLREVIKALCDSKQALPQIWVDASVMSDRVLLRVLKILFEFDVDLNIVYAEAHTYFPTANQFYADSEQWCADETLTLEEGVGDVIPSEEHPGFHTDPALDCVVIFPSFKKDRAHAVLSHVDASLISSPGSSVIWLLGKPRLEEDYWRLDAMRALNKLKEEPFLKSAQHEVSTFDYKDTIRQLEIIYEERRGDYRFTLSMMGSKMQALGTALFCYLHPDVKVVFVTPKRYNAGNYSEGCKGIWHVALGDTGILKKELEKIGTLQIQY